MKFVATGCPRSGTKYTAHLLQELGVDCGHEEVYDSWTDEFVLQSNGQDRVADSQAMIAPYVTRLKVPVLHVVRPPLNVISSLVGQRFFDLDLPYVSYFEHHCPRAFAYPSGSVAQAARFWLDWNALVEDARSRCIWRVHDLGVPEVVFAARLGGVTALRSDVEKALATVPKTVNTRSPRAEVDLGFMLSEVQDRAEQYGLPLGI